MSTEQKYRIAFVRSKDTYDDRHCCYIEAMPAEFTWGQIVDVVTRKTAGLKSKDGWGIIPSHIKRHKHQKTRLWGHWRQRRGCVETSLLILDVEYHPIGDSPADVTKWVRNHFPETRALVYSSWNHGSSETDENGSPKWVPGEPRFRVIIPLKTPVESQNDWGLVYQWVIEHCGDGVDASCKDPCRLSYLLRAKNPKASLDPFAFELDGHPLDVEALPDGGSLTLLKEKKEEEEAARRKALQKRRRGIESGDLHLRQNHVARYARAALEGCATDIVRASEGNRHNTIYQKAFYLGTMVASDMIPEGAVIVDLHEAARVALPPDRHDEALKAIKAGVGDAQSNPFDLTQLATPTRSAVRAAVAELSWDDIVDDNGFGGMPTITVEGGAQ